jgi:hypothetical protein
MGNFLQTIGAPTIIFLVIVVLNVVSQILKEAAKKREAEEKRQAALRSDATMVQPLPSRAQTSIAESPMSKPVPNRADELAARRKAQLDQLRQRRENRRTGQPVSPPTAVTRATRPISNEAARRTAVIRNEPATLKEPEYRSAELRRLDDLREREQHKVDVHAHQQRQELVGQKIRKQAAAAQAQAQAQVARLRQATARAQAQTLEAATVAAQNATPAAIRRDLGNQASLRRLIVLQEVLGQPISMRPM